MTAPTIPAAPPADSSTPPAPVSSQPSTDGPARNRRLTIVAVVLVLAALVCGQRLYTDLSPVVSHQAMLVGLVFAAIPVLPLVGCFWWVGRYRPEPTFLLVYTLLWGALIATYLSLHLNSWLAGKLEASGGSTIRSAVFVAPWVEETCKAVIIFLIAWWRRHDFGGVVAGIVYGGLVGIGFAFTENIVYYAQVYEQAHTANQPGVDPWGEVAHLFLWRGVAAPFIHPMFTLLTGAGIGVAVRYRHLGVRLLAPVVGFTAAVLLHMSYNAAASLSAHKALLALYAGLLIPTVLGVSVAVVLIRRSDQRVLAARLRDYTIYGWLQPNQVPYLVSPRGRREARRNVRRLSPNERAKVEAVQRTAVDLAVLRDRFVRGVAGKREMAQEARLIAELRDQLDRTVLPGPDDVRGPSVTARSSW